jgi:hypothetical protein
MTSQFDYRALLVQYVHLIERRFRSDQLDEFSGFTGAARSEIRRLSEGGTINPSALMPERTGGTGPRSWFSELNNLSPEDYEAAMAWGEKS